MNQLVTGDEIRKIEQRVINEIGIPSLVLMERAALSVTEHIKQKFLKTDRICVICGTGNNGADGVTIARQLMESDYNNVDVVVLGKEEKFSKEMKTQLSIFSKLGLSYFNEIPSKDYNCMVDAIFGVGLTRKITDRCILNAIETINLSDAYIYSVDIPSGIHTETGRIMGSAVKADETITFTCEKVGLFLFPGKEYAGKIFCKAIGIWDSCINKTSHYTLNENEGAELLKRNASGNKGTFGKVTILAGNNEISGAAVLCASAALKSGAGMVKVLSNDKTLDIIRRVLPEAMTQSLDEKDFIEEKIQDAVKWADCVVIGPGIGTDAEAYKKIYSALKNISKETKLVVDADGINLLSKHIELRELTEKVSEKIYTPHMMELSRFTGKDITVLQDNLDEVMDEVVSESNAVYVCKDSVTRVYLKDKPVFINRFGNSGMATAGSGDVLAGVIAGIIARAGMDYYKGTVVGVNVHSLAGDFAAKERGKNALLAGDIIEALPKVLKKMEDFI